MASSNDKGILRSRSYLEEKFEDGKRPTGQDFADFIASGLNLEDDGLTVVTDGDGETTCIQFDNPIQVALEADFDPAGKECVELGNGSFYNKVHGSDPLTDPNSTNFAHTSQKGENEFALRQDSVGEVTLNAPMNQTVQISNNGQSKVMVDGSSMVLGDAGDQVGLTVNGDSHLIGDLTLETGTSIAKGQVLTADDSTGKAQWETPAFTEDSGSSGTYASNGDIQIGDTSAGDEHQLAVNGTTTLTSNPSTANALDINGKAHLTGDLQLSIGALGSGKVLTDINGTGDATWETPAFTLNGTTYEANEDIQIGGTTGGDEHQLTVNGTTILKSNPTTSNALEITGPLTYDQSPGNGKVLTDSNGSGKAEWQTPAFTDTAGVYQSNGDIEINDPIKVNGLTTTPSAGLVLTAIDAQGTLDWVTNQGTSPWQHGSNFAFFEKGNVGIGTNFNSSNLPQVTLDVDGETHINNGSGTALEVTGDTTLENTTVDALTTNGAFTYNQGVTGDGSILESIGAGVAEWRDPVWVKNTPAVPTAIKTEHNIGIGLKGPLFPSRKLEVDGESFFTAPSGAIALDVVGKTRLDGELEINITGPTPGNGDQLTFDSGLVKWAAPTSDRRLKKNIQPLLESLDKLRQVNLVEFMFNGKGGTTDGREQIGVIAQELQEVFPKLVSARKGFLNEYDTEQTDILHIDPKPFTFILIKAVQELADKVDTLEQQLTSLLTHEKNLA